MLNFILFIEVGRYFLAGDDIDGGAWRFWGWLGVEGGIWVGSGVGFFLEIGVEFKLAGSCVS